MIPKSIILEGTGLERINTPQYTEEKFSLQYNDLIVGELQLNNGNWTFEYSIEFQNQNVILPLVNFPIKEKKYVSTELWPFFTSRIPGVRRPDVQEEIKKAKIDDTDEAALLKLFGKNSIANPFILTPTSSRR